MRFHLTHGSAIQLHDGQTIAKRSETVFGNGIVFTDSPIILGQKLCLELGSTTIWSGALRVGATTHSPAKLLKEELPKFAYPGLVGKDGFWARVINENLLSKGCHLLFYLTKYGHLQFFINGEHKGVLLQGLPTSKNVWLLFDIYGNTTSAKFVTPDNIPREIYARGPDAVEAYEQACTGGTQPVYRTRLMLVGQERVGKTSLKRALTGQSHNAQEEATDGIDASASCSFSLANHSSWRLSVKGDETVRREKLQDSVDLGVLGGIEGLEEEYNRAIACNIVQELLHHRKQSSITTEDESLKELTTTKSQKGDEAKGLSTAERSHSVLSKESVLSEINEMSSTYSEIPNRVVTLVTDILKKREKAAAQGTLSVQKSINESVILNIWDFAGQAVYHTSHQVFLTNRAVYCIIFNLCDDLEPQTEETSDKNHGIRSKLGTLQYMDFWMRSIHAHAAENTKANSVENVTLSPPIFIVGTHKNGLDSDSAVRSQMIEDKFAEIRGFIMGKPYSQHVVLPFFAVENDMTDNEDPEIGKLREEIERVASKQTYIAEQIPVKWLRFEQEVTSQADAGVTFASYDQIYELAVNHNINTPGEVKSLLNFYHDLGTIIYYGNSAPCDYALNDTIILNPQWLADMVTKVTASFPPKEEWNLMADKWVQLMEHGILDENLIPLIWADFSGCQTFLIGLMSKLDLLCQQLPPAGQTHRRPCKTFYVPMRFSPYKDKKKIYAETVYDAKFYIDFNGFLPDGLFHRIQARTICWSQEHGGRDLFLAKGMARVFVDADHDMLLEKAAYHLHRIKVLIMHVKDKEATSLKRNTSPVPEVVAKVRNFLEACLADLRSLWMKRISYKMCFACPCNRVCGIHETSGCSSEECLHFLDIDECLTNQVVCCEHRRLNSDIFKKCFPSPYSKEFKEPIIPPLTIEQGMGNIERHVPNLPSWLKGAAKLLNGACENQDWLALAQAMGYKQGKIDMFTEDVNPSLALLTDWIVSSGNTTMSVDVLLHYLTQLGCDDVIDIINRAKENELDRPQIFISYQWDSQDEVCCLRDHLERAGFSCWMDIGQMGGGDLLSNKIDKGLRGCKTVIACITPKFVASQSCNRELWLADVLQKPIIPVMMEHVTWPPPGAMAVILAQLLYINMKGVGGHGGTGIHADLADKYNEIVQRVSLHAMPDLTPCVDTTVITKSDSQHHRSEKLSDRFSGYRTSMSSLSEVDFQRYNSHYDSSLDVMLSRYEEGAENNNNNSHTISNRQTNRNTNPVPQAKVENCAICIIL